MHGLEAHIPARAVFGNSIFSWKKVLATKNISVFNNDHRRDIYNCLSFIHYLTFSLLLSSGATGQPLAAGVPQRPDTLPPGSALPTP